MPRFSTPTAAPPFTRCVTCALTLCLLAALTSAEDTPPDLAARVSAFRADFAGAAPATRERVLTDLRDDLSSHAVRFDGIITGFGGFTLPGSEDTDRAATMTGWRHQGLYVQPVGCGVSTREECAALAAQRLRTVLPAGDSGTMIMVRKDRILVYALTQDQDLVDQLRSGRQVRIVIWTQGMFDETVFGVLDSAKMISDAVACDNGHRYPADVGFNFCPKCGKPINYQ